MIIISTRLKKNKKKKNKKNNKKNKKKQEEEQKKQDEKTTDTNKFFKYIENESKGISYDLFRKYFDFETSTQLTKK